MVVHAFRVVTSDEQKDNPNNPPQPEPPSVPDAVQSRLDDLLANNYTEVLTDQAIAATLIEPVGGGTVHVTSTRRVDSGADKATLLDDVANQVRDLTWYEVQFHECSHDAAEPPACPPWTEARQAGNPPSDVTLP